MENKKSFDRVLLTLGLVVAAALAFAACSRTETPLGLNADASGHALRGFDAVAYFAADSAIQGDPKYEYAWNGAKWRFSSEENMKKFPANPEAYAPQFGGYCSYAVSEPARVSVRAVPTPGTMAVAPTAVPPVVIAVR